MAASFFAGSVARMQAEGRNPGTRHKELPGLRCISSGLHTGTVFYMDACMMFDHGDD